MQPIHIADYPQLSKITWNRTDATTIDEREAFALYEANWRFVDVDAMPAHEKLLIEHLKQEVGKGVMYV
jgi:hypothetical protein